VSATTRQATIEQAFALRAAELRCQAAQSQALATFLASPDRAAHWRGMAHSGKRLIVTQMLDKAGYDVTDEAIARAVASYERKYKG
jgi:hypothetical protein